MQLFFIFSLATGVTAIYLTKHTSNDLSYLMGTVALVSLLSSLIIAPWQIKLIILTIVIISIHRVWQHIGIGEEPEIESEDLNKLQQSKLKKAQGHQNSQQRKNQVLQEELTGMYRGHPYHITPSEQNQISKTNYELKYRGVSVTNHQDKADRNNDE